MSLRIVITSDDFIPAQTGAGIHTSRLAMDLARRGHDVVVITTRRPAQLPLEEWNGVRIYRTLSLRIHEFYISISGRGTIEKILRQEKPDVIHHQYLGILAQRSSLAARALGIKQVYTYHMTVDHITLTSPFLKPFQRIMERRALQFYNQCDFITFPARKLQEKAHEMGIRVPSAYISSATGIEETAAAEPLRKESDKAFTILFVGRLNAEKNVSCLIKAFAEFRAKTSQGELWIVGDGQLRNRLVKEAASLGLTPHVRFFGSVNHHEIGSCYAGASVFVLPSLFETQGIVALEAMYYSLPVLVSRELVSADDLVEEGQNGFLIDPASSSDLAKKLLMLHADPAMARRMGLRGREHFNAFGTQSITSKFEELYYQVTGASEMEMPLSKKQRS